jgi:hypothetical protein
LSIGSSFGAALTVMPFPLINYDVQNFNGRPTLDDLYLYAIFRNDVDGSSVLNDRHFAYWVIYVPPNNSLTSRYVLQYPASMSLMSTDQQVSGIPQMAITLETYRNASARNQYSGRLRTTTVSPIPGVMTDGATEADWTPQSSLGYIMTKCPNSVDLNQCDAKGALVGTRIEECWQSSTDDYQLRIDTNGVSGSCPNGWTHLRTAGWLYKFPQSFATKPIYACYNQKEEYHFSSNDAACNSQSVEGLLGYAVVD